MREGEKTRDILLHEGVGMSIFTGVSLRIRFSLWEMSLGFRSLFPEPPVRFRQSERRIGRHGGSGIALQPTTVSPCTAIATSKSVAAAPRRGASRDRETEGEHTRARAPHARRTHTSGRRPAQVSRSHEERTSERLARGLGSAPRAVNKSSGTPIGRCEPAREGRRARARCPSRPLRRRS